MAPGGGGWQCDEFALPPYPHPTVALECTDSFLYGTLFYSPASNLFFFQTLGLSDPNI